MKDRSLYHLLIARLHQLTDGLRDDETPFGKQLKETLTVKFAGSSYQLRWRWQDKARELNVPGDTFSFYVRGDAGKPAKAADLRAENWRHAETILRRMAEACGATLPADSEPGSLSALTFKTNRLVGVPMERIVISALAAGLLAFGLFGPTEAAWTALTALALCYGYSFQRHTLMGQRMNWLESALVAGGSLFPAFLGTLPIGAAMLAGGLAFLAGAESFDRTKYWAAWIAGGALLGAGVRPMGAAAWAPVVVIVVLISLIHAMMPARIGRTATIAVGASAIAAAMLFSLAPVIAAAPAGTPLTALDALSLWLIGAAALLCFSLWWVIGRQERLVPWLAFAAIAAAAFALLATGGRLSATAGLAAFAGYLLCAVVRLTRAFAAASTTAHEPRGLR